ncbi:methyl-accepting chemotaxis protein [Alkalispirillum mobile]|uniref:Methyl-accepting chemotaxis protein n=1 Tax=Alkalispirillum mobile TaxID=85925 RepID=A0A498C5K7_9GAMM|nr:methyl-accepting chemotaxis protein [Alkalispirillum mobile]RLK50257.1 methyl-accepting chemotaxis protein [Alkalispirillum mobile]
MTDNLSLRQRLIKLNIKQKLVLLVLTTSIIPLSLMGGFTFHLMKGQLQTQLEGTLVDMSSEASARTDDYLLQVGDKARVVAEDRRIAIGGGAVAEDLLEQYRDLFPEFDWIGVIDAQGEARATAGEIIGTPAPEEQQGRWADALDSGPTVVGPGAEDGVPRALTLLHPIDQGSQREALWIAAQMDMALLDERIGGVRIGESGRATLFDAAGRLLAHEDSDRTGYDMSHYAIMGPPLEQGEGHPGAVFTSGDGEEKWGLTVMLEGFNDRFGANWGLILDQTTDEIYAPVTLLWWMLWVLWVIAFLVTLAFGLYYAGLIANPLRHLSAGLNNIASGDADLTRRLEVESRDEIGQTAAAFNAVMDRLHELVSKTARSAHQLASATTDMMAASARTGDAMATQRSEVEQVATAMNEMTATVQEVARNTQQAADSAHRASNQAGEGRQMMARAIDSNRTLAEEVRDASGVMAQLKEDSDNIGTILQVITEIAEQTNLLALNAAIEAARAGEQGRGFAVVAGEVRNLAHRTNESTTQIQDIIEQLQTRAERAEAVMQRGQRQAEDSVHQAATTGETLEQVAAQITGINDMNAQIASAAEEQSAVAEDVNRSIHTINDISSRNARGSEEIRAAAENLNKLAEELEQMVRVFKV